MKNEQRKIKTIIAIYGVIIFVIVFAHSFLEGHGFHLDYTISRYLGMEFWSAILFLLTSIVSVIVFSKFIWKFKKVHQMNFLWMFFAMLILVGLLGLSFFPIGLFDEVYGEFGVVSILHKIFSATMFSSAIVFSALSFLKFKEKTTRLNLGVFSFYGSVVALLYATNNPLMMDLIFIFESIFLVWMMIIFLNLSKISQK